MNNLFNISEEEKNRIRGLHIVESDNKKISSILSEQEVVTTAVVSATFNCVPEGCVDPKDGTGAFSSTTDCEVVCKEYNEKIIDLKSRGFVLDGDEGYVVTGDEETEEVELPGVEGTITYYLKASTNQTNLDDKGGEDEKSNESLQQVKDFKKIAVQKFNTITEALVGDLLNVYTSKNTRNKQITDKKGFLGIGSGGLVSQISITAGGVTPTWKINKRRRALSTITGFKFTVVDKRKPTDLTKKSMCIPKQIIYYFTKTNKEGRIRFACDKGVKLYISAMSNGVDQWNPVMQDLYKATQWYNKQLLLAPNTDL